MLLVGSGDKRRLNLLWANKCISNYIEAVLVIFILIALQLYSNRKNGEDCIIWRVAKYIMNMNTFRHFFLNHELFQISSNETLPPSCFNSLMVCWLSIINIRHKFVDGIYSFSAKVACCLRNKRIVGKFTSTAGIGRRSLLNYSNAALGEFE